MVRLWWCMCLIGLILFSSVAECHTRLVSSYPARDQVLGHSPSHLTLTFSAPVESEFSRIELVKEKDQALQVLKVRVDGKTVHGDLPKLLPGTYVVRWRVLARDGHAQRGQFRFELR